MDPGSLLFSEPPASLVRSSREILVQVSVVAEGRPVKRATVHARGVDPSRPWYERLTRLDRRDDAVAATPYGTRCFRVMEGTRIGLAVYQRERGCVERVVWVQPDGSGQGMLVEIEMPAEQEPCPVGLELTCTDFRPGHTQIIRRLHSPILRLKLDWPTGSFCVVPGTYWLHASLSQTLDCAIGLELTETEAWEGAPVTVAPGTRMSVVGAFERGSGLAIKTSDGRPGRSNGEMDERQDLLTATVRRRGDSRAYVPPEIVRGASRTGGLREEAFHLGDPVTCKRAFLPGDYTVTVEGPNFEPATVHVTVPIPSEERTGLFGGYGYERVEATLRLERRRATVSD